MKNAALVSVLMPAFNAEKFIAEAINSILNQEHQCWELLILDDGSTDSTLSIVKSFSDARIKPFQHKKNLGYLQSCNALFEKAEGDFITFLDADDSCSKDRLSCCLAAFQSDVETGFVTTNHSRIEQDGKLISEHKIEVDYSKYASNPGYYPTICCATIFIRKELLEKVGGYHSFFEGIGGEDYHWLFRLSLHGKGIHLSNSTYQYRRHEGQLHLRNIDPLKHFSKDIDQDIRLSLIQGTDLLNKPDELRRKYENRIALNRSELHFRKAAEALNHSEPSRFKAEIKYAVKSHPLSISTWRKATYLIYSHFARNP